MGGATTAAGRIPLIERYADRLPIEPGWEVVSLLEGSTPLIPAPRLSERLGCETHLKFDGMNPTGSFKDRGMTVAVTAAKAKSADKETPFAKLLEQGKLPVERKKKGGNVASK